MDNLDGIIAEAKSTFDNASDLAALEQAKARFLGKTGALSEMLKALGKLSAAERPQAGARINTAKEQVEDLLKARREAIELASLEARLAEEALDVTLPGRGRNRGGIHPVIRTWQRIEVIFRSLGFDVADGPEIETDWYNFTALNQPENHPARSMHDTFYVEGGLLLRTHTSPMQVRYAKKHTPPIKVISPGRTYRVDSDATHSPMFHQVEGLWLDEDISFADLKGVYTEFLRKFFETDALMMRFRPSIFPFPEPSAEIDMAFPTGTHKGLWLEISGDREVHPNLVRNFGLAAER